MIGVELLLEASVARGRRRSTLESERRHRDLPAVVEPADDVVLRASRVREEHLVELGRAVGLHDRPDLDAVLLHRHEQVADACVLRHLRVGARQQEDVVGVLRLRGPDLLAVDHPLVAVEVGTCLQPGEVGTGIGFAEALAPRDLSGQDLREELLLLLLAPPLQDRRTDERVAEEVSPQGRARTSELLVEHDVLHGRQALAAVLLGPGSADPAAVEELLRPLLLELATLLGRHREVVVEPAVGQVLLEPVRGSRSGTPRRRRDTSDP